MKFLVLLMAVSLLPLSSNANGPSCSSVFEKKTDVMDSYNHNKIVSESSEAFFTATESEMSRAEWDGLVTAFREKTKQIQGRTVTHMGKSAFIEGNKVAITQVVIGNKKITERAFELENANGFFEAERGQLWVMPHNVNRVVVWNFAKNRVYDVVLPEKGTFLEIRFDYTSNIYQPKMVIEYQPHPEGVQAVESKTIEIDLITGKEI